MVNYEIKNANKNDILGMLEILNNNLISNHPNKSKSDLEEKGFLIYPFTFEEIEKQLADENFIILVAKKDEEIVGYIIDYLITSAEFEWLSDCDLPTQLLNKLMSENTLFHRHIGTKPDLKGVGTQLMQTLIERAKTKGYKNIICQIALAPILNKKSINFHEKFGFQMIGKVSDQEKDVSFGVFWKQIS